MMKHVEEAAVSPETSGTDVPRKSRDALSPLPSEDQKDFNEVLFEGLRSMGALVRSRRKPK